MHRRPHYANTPKAGNHTTVRHTHNCGLRPAQKSQPLADSKPTDYKDRSLHCTGQDWSINYFHTSLLSKTERPEPSRLCEHSASDTQLPFHNLPVAAVHGKYLFMEKGAPTSGYKKGFHQQLCLPNKWHSMQAVATNNSL